MTPESLPISYYRYFPKLDYLPLSDTERKIMALVLTFEIKGKGLCLSNPKIGQVINRSQHTVKKAITGLREKGLINTEKQKSPHRIIRPAKPENYLTAQNGQVETCLLDHFRILLDRYSGPLLDRPERSTELRNKVKKKTDFPFPDVTPQEIKPPQETPDPEKLARVFDDLGLDSESIAANG